MIPHTWARSAVVTSALGCGLAFALAGAETATTAGLDAVLVDAKEKAAARTATVQVSTTAIELVDPASRGEKPAAGEGHLHYQVDDGPVIATTATKLSFHELSAGDHTIRVVLAGNDHRPLGPSDVLNVTVP